jgi:phospholipase C
MQTRREFIKRASMLSGAVGFAAGVPGSIQRAFAIAPDPGTTWADAEHVVILMQENRSFDHALGTLQGVRGFNDPRAIRQANGNSIFLQTSEAGETFAPWRLDIKDTKITWMGSIPHVRHSQVDAWNRGFHNGWIDAKRSHNSEYKHVPITMGHYTREDIPFYYALADAFTVCDQHYSGVMTSTTPNRSMFWTGTVRDEQNTSSKVYMRNPELFRGNLTWKTFPERLSDAGIDWKFYQNELNIADLDAEQTGWLGALGNVTEFFAAYNVSMSDDTPAQIQQKIDSTKAQIAKMQTTPVDPTMVEDNKAAILQKQNYLQALEKQLASGGGGLSTLSHEQRDLHHRAFVTNKASGDYRALETISFEENGKTVTMQVPKGDVFHQFREDVNAGKLPAISWLSPPPKFSDHPSHPWYGAWFVSEAVDILTRNPEVWKKTIFILTYDENDGYFDHCPSFVAANPQDKATGGASEGIDTGMEYTYARDEVAQGVAEKQARSGPIGLGFRVPLIVASPWSRGGWVNSQVFEHTSTLQFLEQYVQARFHKNVRETNISNFRRTISGDLTSVFRPADRTTPQLPFLSRDKFVESIQRARDREVPSNYKPLSAEQVATYNRGPRSTQIASQQEPGIRPACALPYELYCEGGVRAGDKVFALSMRAGNKVHGARSAGAPFNIYLRNIAQPSSADARGPNNLNMSVATYVVKAGDTLEHSIPLQLFGGGKYEIDVHGPNGFYRAYEGDVAGSPISIHCTYESAPQGLTGNIAAQLRNNSTRPVSLALTDNSYGSGATKKELTPGQVETVIIHSEKSHGWYDFTVHVTGSTSLSRYAGRVETGKSSFTDPFMGGVAL